jgi:vitamin B12 transporter
MYALPVLAAPAADTMLSAVTVTATRSPSRIDELISEVTVIDREMLDRMTGRTLVEVLASQPGIEFTSNGGLGKTSGLFIRGMDARHTLLLVDGIRVGSATQGAPSLDNLPLESIERIEIVRGPMSSLYGSDAVGGVVQIFTRRGLSGLHPHAKATVGSRRYNQLAGGAAFGEGGFDADVELQHTENRGFSATAPGAFGHNPDDDGFRQDGGSARLGWQVTPDWRIEALGMEADGVTRLDDGPGVDSKAQLRNRVLSLRAIGGFEGGLRTTFTVARSEDEYDTLVTASTFPGSLGPIESAQRQFTWEGSVPTRLGNALAVLERIEQDVSKPGEQFAVRHRFTNGAALGLHGSAAGHTWQASVRHDSNSQFGDQTTGGVGWGYQITPRWDVGASLGTSFVAPSFNQLYFPGFGNASLQPEEGRHGELNAHWSAAGQSVRATWFDNRIRGFISSGPAPVNVRHARMEGVSLSYEGQVRDLALAVSLDHLDPHDADSGRQLPRRARNAARARADWTTGAVTLGAAVLAFSSRYDDVANTRQLGGYATLDLHAQWHLAPDWTLSAQLNNVADKRYQTAFAYNQPGREAYLSVRYAPK